MKMLHTMIRVRDLEKSLEFYCGFIGLHEVRRKAIADEATLVFLSDEDERYFVELTFNHDGPDYTLGDQYGHLAFGVPDLGPVEAEVKRRGWEYWPSRPEVGSKYLFVCDPDGYDVEILETGRKP
ncbi:MAG: VOC family protein [Acidobacteriota bacterium]